ncbi:MAG: hypothetical protein OXD31_04825 [Chloroflexi bacterium]|nr:hypothetical protein [Chloroflexota bacterium]
MIPVVSIKRYRKVPTEDEILAKMLEALRQHGNSATNAEIKTYVIAVLNVTELVQSYNYSIKDDLDPILSRGKTKYKKMGFVSNPRRGTWKLTEKGLVKATRKPASPNVQISESFDFPSEVFLGNIIDEDVEVNPDKIVMDRMLKEMIEDVFITLNEREARVLGLRFGLEDGESRTLEEVARDFGVTRERIRLIEAKALRKLRHPNRSKKLRDFLD